MNRGLVCAAILVITLLSFFVFPGHTYLQQDTQIYAPILENQWRHDLLANDLLVQHPHVNFTFYDELTYAVRFITRVPLKYVLEAEQIAFRALGFWGIYLIALALRVDTYAALVVTAICALGATVSGPAVLTIEYEPTPRCFAVPLLMLAAGLSLRERYLWAGVAASSAFLLHAPTTWPFWLAYFGLVALRRRAAWAFVPLTIAAIVLLMAGFADSAHEPQRLFDRLPRDQEALQRLRAAYNYVSTWWRLWIAEYLLLALIAMGALWRMKPPRETTVLFGGLLAAGLGSIPLSWLLLEHEKLAIIPQIQPARALLFVTALAALLSAAMGCIAAIKRSRAEALSWWIVAMSIPVEWFSWKAAVVAAIAATTCAVLPAQWRLAPAMLLAPALLLAIGRPYRNIDTPELAALAHWARAETTSKSVFVFPDMVRGREPGWFRSEALRAVYVDWKGGGQVNYLRDLGSEWWRRWEAVTTLPVSRERYRKLDINYVAVQHPLKWDDLPVFHNRDWYVYRP